MQCAYTEVLLNSFSSTSTVRNYISSSATFQFWGGLSTDSLKISQLWKATDLTVRHFPRQVQELQCRHLIPALNVWAARALYTTARMIDTWFHGHGCMDYLRIERRFYMKATLRSLMCLDYFLTC